MPLPFPVSFIPSHNSSYGCIVLVLTHIKANAQHLTYANAMAYAQVSGVATDKICDILVGYINSLGSTSRAYSGWLVLSPEEETEVNAVVGKRYIPEV